MELRGISTQVDKITMGKSCLLYTSCVKNSSYNGDIVKEVSDACPKQGMDLGVYLSPWDMHDERYGTDAYNDYFCNQLTELLTNYEMCIRDRRNIYGYFT